LFNCQWEKIFNRWKDFTKITLKDSNMTLKKISDRIYYLPSEERTDRPVLGYIKGDKYSLAVDAGNSAGHVEKFYRNLIEMGLRLPDFTVITHWHWDHSFGMHAVSGKTVAGHLTNKRLGEIQKWEWTDAAMKRRLQTGEDLEICDRCIRLEYPDLDKIRVVTSGIEFTGAISIDLGGIHGEIREFNDTHSGDAVLVHVPEERVLFLGDADCGDFHKNHGKYDQTRLNEMIRALEKIDADIFMAGHDVPQSKLNILNLLKDELDKPD
jgi:glyoxylase-like metal-dependent hydrolase (beta-lactamase superfamily II)